MKKRWIKKRRIIVNHLEYFYSVIDYEQDRKIRIFEQAKVPLLILRLTYPQAWGIDAFRPKTIAVIIDYYQGHRPEIEKTPCFYLQKNQQLYNRLVEIFFPEEKSQQKERFLLYVEKFGKDEFTR